MNRFNLCSIFILSLSFAGLAQAQPTDPYNKPGATFGNAPKPSKESPYRIIEGTVKDATDNPVTGAIVQLKNTKTSNVVSFPTKGDGKFAFRELSMDVDYELLAKHGERATPVKKVSIYDSRKNVTVNFRFEPTKQP